MSPVLIRLLEKKSVIRIFGVCLFLAPIMNTWAALLVRPEPSSYWTLQLFWQIFSSGNMVDHLLYSSSMLIGLIMWRGSTDSWRWVLVFMGGHILRQIFQLGENIRSHWVYGLFFLINVAIFFFLLDQLVLKQKKTPPGKKKTAPLPAKPRTQPLRARKRVLIHFEGLGPWGLLTGISAVGFEVRALGPIPERLADREVELKTGEGLIIRARLSQQKENECSFAYSQLDSQGVQKINQWLLRQAA
jgi:hypothetical protein